MFNSSISMIRFLNFHILFHLSSTLYFPLEIQLNFGKKKTSSQSRCWWQEWSVQDLIYLKYGLKIQNITLLNQLIAWELTISCWVDYKSLLLWRPGHCWWSAPSPWGYHRSINPRTAGAVGDPVHSLTEDHPAPPAPGSLSTLWL